MVIPFVASIARTTAAVKKATALALRSTLYYKVLSDSLEKIK
jgi:hypothetical protein